jgi:hypothetical protein
MRRLQVDRRDRARRAHYRRRPSIGLDDGVHLDDCATVVPAAALQVTQRAARFLARSQGS